MAKAKKKAEKRCALPMMCPTPMAVATMAGKQARTCDDKRAAVALWKSAAGRAVAADPTNPKNWHIFRLFHKKAAAAEKFCTSDAAKRAAAKAKAEWGAAGVELERQRAAGGMFGLGRMRSRRSAARRRSRR